MKSINIDAQPISQSIKTDSTHQPRPPLQISYFDSGAPKMPSPAPASGAKRKARTPTLGGGGGRAASSSAASASTAGKEVEIIDILDDDDEEEGQAQAAAAAAGKLPEQQPPPPPRAGGGKAGGSDSDDEAMHAPPDYDKQSPEEGEASGSQRRWRQSQQCKHGQGADCAECQALQLQQEPPQAPVPSTAAMTPGEAALLAHVRKELEKPELAPGDVWPKVRHAYVGIRPSSVFGWDVVGRLGGGCALDRRKCSLLVFPLCVRARTGAGPARGGGRLLHDAGQERAGA